MKRCFFFLLLTMIACSKTGPTGPQGEQGIQGKPGGTGAQGPQGPQGNANVQVYEKDISTLKWTAAGTYLYMQIPAPNVLTENVLNTSTILVYVYTSDFNGWGIVPYNTERNIRVTAEIGVGYVQLRKDQNGVPSTQSWHSKIRLVIIKNTATNQLTRQQEINMNDYPVSLLKSLD
ncbi:collagen-like protein [Chitinophaga sp. RCC_12]|uniref:collagen-like triple helix repeat-containing protein n=1 Tax=Chitinophaga sp. RCC_12 TaxID=3239226 RepID=UPI003525A844